jgi:hypothetical protein
MDVKVEPNTPDAQGRIWCPLCGEMVPCLTDGNDQGEGTRKHRELAHPAWAGTFARVQLCIKWNNAVVNDPCEICGERTDPIEGPEIFVEGTWGLVCTPCARREAPVLWATLQTMDGIRLEEVKWRAREAERCAEARA